MNTVNCDPLDRWGWECPECGEWHEMDEDPNYEDSVVCDACRSEFKPEVAG